MPNLPGPKPRCSRGRIPFGASRRHLPSCLWLLQAACIPWLVPLFPLQSPRCVSQPLLALVCPLPPSSLMRTIVIAGGPSLGSRTLSPSQDPYLDHTCTVPFPPVSQALRIGDVTVSEWCGLCGVLNSGAKQLPRRLSSWEREAESFSVAVCVKVCLQVTQWVLRFLWDAFSVCDRCFLASSEPLSFPHKAVHSSYCYPQAG